MIIISSLYIASCFCMIFELLCNDTQLIYNLFIKNSDLIYLTCLPTKAGFFLLTFILKCLYINYKSKTKRMKKIFLIITMISLMALPVFSQFVMFEQDFRFPTGQKAIPFSQITWEQTIKSGFSIAPYFATSTGWNEGFMYLNFNVGNVYFGIGPGIEQLETWSFRVSPWIKFTPQIGGDSTKSLCIFSLWEIGQGVNNYWYTNSITYETSKISLGALARRYYGVGPLFGYKFKASSLNIKFSAAPLYDFEDSTFKPTVILTITN